MSTLANVTVEREEVKYFRRNGVRYGLQLELNCEHTNGDKKSFTVRIKDEFDENGDVVPGDYSALDLDNTAREDKSAVIIAAAKPQLQAFMDNWNASLAKPVMDTERSDVSDLTTEFTGTDLDIT